MSCDSLMLEDLNIQLIDGDRGKNYPKQSEFDDKGHCLFLSAKNVTKTGFQFVDKVYIPEDRHNLLRSGKLERNDIVLTTRGTIGNVAFYDNSIDEKVVRVNSGMLILRADSSSWNPRFLYFLFTSRIVQEQISLLTSGSAVPQLPAKDLKKFSLPKVPMGIQDYIVKVIGDLSDKLVINIQTNQTLEAMAQAIFKSWFVDFDPVKAKMRGELPEGMDEATAALFPNKLIDSELGMIPEGWEVKSLASLIKLTGGGTPKRSEADYWNGNIPWFSVKDAPSASNVFVVDTEEKITEQGLSKSSTKLLAKGTTIITARGTVGKLALLGTEMCMNQSCYGIKGNEVGDLYNYFNLNQAVSTLQQNTHGAVFDTITTKTFETYSLAFSGSEIANIFDSIIEPLLRRIEMSVRENSELSTLRDTLLPKLLSGEIQINHSVQGGCNELS